MEEEDQSAQKQISCGNQVAHGGDCMTDADLYRQGEQTDGRVFWKIYGMTTHEIELLGENSSDLPQDFHDCCLIFYQSRLMIGRASEQFGMLQTNQDCAETLPKSLVNTQCVSTVVPICKSSLSNA